MAEGGSRAEDLRHLRQMFTELDPEVIADVYDAHEGDMQQTMSALFTIAKDAGKAGPMSQEPTGDHGQSSSAYDGSAGQGGLGAAALPPNWENVSWETTINNMDRMLGTISETVADSLNHLALNLRSWVSDISLSFDASSNWDGQQGQQTSTDDIPQPQGMDRNAAVVAHHSESSDVLHHRNRVERAPSIVERTNSLQNTSVDNFGDAKKDD